MLLLELDLGSVLVLDLRSVIHDRICGFVRVPAGVCYRQRSWKRDGICLARGAFEEIVYFLPIPLGRNSFRSKLEKIDNVLPRVKLEIDGVKIVLNTGFLEGYNK
ncbi:hypothetical protein KQX54_016447 [Cotesia glomerata]|uniref:Uncharacterized protein n=1 Tax=Cotesia glomerata TaxID=32391 RepID=A0AAV7IC41_COTGL|nr:hypothetical protein KQX54_016447 [Cotesia glomerata]